jgi:uncharacterized protein YhbP (UPF0306 family)
VQPDASVHPDQQHHGRLLGQRNRIEHKVDQQHENVAVVRGEKLGGETVAQDM